MARRQIRASLGGLTVRFADGVQESIPWVRLRARDGLVFVVADKPDRYPRAAKGSVGAVPTMLVQRLRQRQLRRIIRTTGWHVECWGRELRESALGRAGTAWIAAGLIAILPLTGALPILRDSRSRVMPADWAIVGTLTACSLALLVLGVPAAMRQVRQLRSLASHCPADLRFEQAGVRIETQDGRVDRAAWAELPLRLDVPESRLNSDLLPRIFYSSRHGAIVRDAALSMCPALAGLEARRHGRQWARIAILALLAAAFVELWVLGLTTIEGLDLPPGICLAVGAIVGGGLWVVSRIPPDSADRLAWRLHRWRRRRRHRRAPARRARR